MSKSMIACVYFNVTGSADWDTEHVRLTASELERYPLKDDFGHDKAKVIAKWTDDEYKARWGKPYEDHPALPWMQQINQQQQ